MKNKRKEILETLSKYMNKIDMSVFKLMTEKELSKYYENYIKTQSV